MRAAGDRGQPSSDLSSLLDHITDQFVFECVNICGSHANSWAIDDATNYQASLCLFAAGSYVAGDGGALQSYSTSEFAPGFNLATIVHPNQVKNPLARENTIPLPYHIPGVLPAQELREYEDKCLQAVHIHLCWAKMRRKPYKALLLELILAGNGATLSNRALISIGKLAAYHGLRLIVDEIMTGGRTGQMFLLLSKPPSFVSAVTHITLGKWTQMGMVFLSTAWADQRKNLYPCCKRGASTFLCGEDARIHWTTVKACLSEIPAKRDKVLEKLKLTEADVWGEGLLIFGPVRWNHPKGLHCRYLPMIHKDTPIDSVRHALVSTARVFRKDTNKTIVDAVKAWIEDEPQPMVHPDLSDAEKKMEREKMMDFIFIANVVKSHKELDDKQSVDWKALCLPADANRNEAEAVLGRLKLAGGMEQIQVGKKRQRKWQITQGFISPYKSADFDEVVNW